MSLRFHPLSLLYLEGLFQFLKLPNSYWRESSSHTRNQLYTFKDLPVENNDMKYVHSCDSRNLSSNSILNFELSSSRIKRATTNSNWSELIINRYRYQLNSEPIPRIGLQTTYDHIIEEGGREWSPHSPSLSSPMKRYIEQHGGVFVLQ